MQNINVKLEIHKKLADFLFPYQKRVAELNNAAHELSRLVFEIESKHYSVFPFRLINKNAKENTKENLRVCFRSKKAFLSALIIDFLEFRDPESYVDFVLSNALVHGQVTKEVLRKWYLINKTASIIFFETPGALQNYFKTNQTVTKWWHKQRVNQPLHENYAAFIQDRIENLRERNFSHVLDLGCGFGRFVNLIDKTKCYILCDISHDMLKAIKQNKNDLLHSSLFLCQADMCKLPLKRRWANFIIVLQVLMHIRKPFQALFDICQNYLQDNGIIVLDYTCILDESVSWIQKSPLTRVYSKKFFESSVRELGLDIIDSFLYQETSRTFWHCIFLKKRRLSC